MDFTQNSVINFIDEVNKQRSLDDTVKAINDDPAIKLRRLNETKKQGVNACMNSIFAKICADAIPEINGRTADTPDLDKVVSDYVSRRTGGKDLEFYVKEAIRRNPKNTDVIKNMYESVERIVNKEYEDKTLNPETITENDLAFRLTPEIDDKLSTVIKDNNLDDLAEVIKDNVRNTAITEVELAKKEKEERMALEEELTNDDSITTEAALEEALRERGIGRDVSVYTPSLFEAVMINKFNEAAKNVQPVYETEYTLENAYVTEGVIDKIKSAFKAKAEADAKATIASSHPKFTATIEGLYKTVYAEYRSKITPINMGKIASLYKDAVSSDVQIVSSVDLEEVKRASAEFKDQMKSLMESKTVKRFVIPKGKKQYVSGSEAIKTASNAVKALDSFFAKPDVKSFVNKASSYVTVKANKCDNPKDVLKVYELAVEYYVAELAYYSAAIDHVVSVVECTKKIIKKYGNVSVKESAFDAAVTEYTLLNISKALYLENFGLMDIDNIALEYAKV